MTFYSAKGCDACQDIGYRGRIGLYEMIIMDDALRDMIHTGASEADMAAHAFQTRQTLLQSGAQAVAQGLTTPEEVLRVCKAKTAEAI